MSPASCIRGWSFALKLFKCAQRTKSKFTQSEANANASSLTQMQMYLDQIQLQVQFGALFLAIYAHVSAYNTWCVLLLV